MVKKEKVISEFKKETRTLIISAFSFIAALSWNNAIQSIIKAFIPSENSWPYLLGNAVIITLIAVLITLSLSKN